MFQAKTELNTLTFARVFRVVLDPATSRGDLSYDHYYGFAQVEKHGGAAAVVFLGDLLDNNRHRVEETGRCAHDGSQFEVLDALLALKREARLSGGDVVWVLGNHDVWNVSPHNHACKRYAPQRQRRRPAQGAYATCTAAGGFSPTHIKHVRACMAQAGVVALVRVTASGPRGSTHVLGVHGGLANVQALVDAFGVVPGDHLGNLRKINEAYRRGVLYGENLRALEGGEHMPTWCRPTKVENPAALRAFFGTARVVKAHDVQGRANCNVAGKTRPEREQSMEDGELCRIDVMMSRAFESKGKGRGKKEFACVLLTADANGRMRRRILRATEALNGALEYPKYLAKR